MLNLLNDVLLRPYFDEKLRALKYQKYFAYAHDILHPEEASKSPSGLKEVLAATFPSLFEQDEVQRACKALGILAELARNYPYRVQEIIDEICSFVRIRWHKDRPYAEKWNAALVAALKILFSLPKKDLNQHPYYVELTGLRIQQVDLKGANFENFVLWESEFINVNMTRSNFGNTDLGGCVFAAGTSVEWSDFSGALMNVAFNGVPTTFDRALLWGSKFDEARIDRCKMMISDGFNTTEIKSKFGDRLEVVMRG